MSGHVHIFRYTMFYCLLHHDLLFRCINYVNTEAEIELFMHDCNINFSFKNVQLAQSHVDNIIQCNTRKTLCGHDKVHVSRSHCYQKPYQFVLLDSKLSQMTAVVLKYNWHHSILKHYHTCVNSLQVKLIYLLVLNNPLYHKWITGTWNKSTNTAVSLFYHFKRSHWLSLLLGISMMDYESEMPDTSPVHGDTLLNVLHLFIYGA